MDASLFLDILHISERLKDAHRHCKTSQGRQESVAEHCWRVALMADMLRDEFPDADMDKVVRMCLWHDMGEAFTGDIPVFEKTKQDEEEESGKLTEWLKNLPNPLSTDLVELFAEMDAMQTQEAKIYKAFDALEALIQHNESDIKTWLPLEYDLQKTYGWNRTEFSEYLTTVREAVLRDTQKKIQDAETDFVG